MILAFAMVVACKGADPQPDDPMAAPPASEPVRATEPASPSPPPSAPPLPIVPNPTPKEVVAPPSEPPLAAEIETHTLTPDGDPLLQLLGKGVPEAVELIAVHEHGRERIALYRLDVAAQWASNQPDADVLLEPYADLIEECTSSYGEVVVECIVEGAAKIPSVPAEVVAYHASESDAFELAHVKLESDTQGKVLARKRLYDYGFNCSDPDCFETKLKVYDMDGDGRSEILATFPLEVPSDHNFGGDSTPAALVFVLDKSDFHVQFATTRKYYDYGGDLSTHESKFETSFVARDTDSDSHADLIVREFGTESSTGMEEEEDPEHQVTRTDQSITCPWERAGDRWVCPSAIGTQVIDGSKRVESTRIPLPAPTPEAGPAPALEP